MDIGHLVKYVTLGCLVIAVAIATNAGYDRAADMVFSIAKKTYDPALYTGNDAASSAMQQSLAEINANLNLEQASVNQR